MRLVWWGCFVVALWFVTGSTLIVMIGCVMMFVGLVLMPEPIQKDPLWRYLDERGLLDKP